MHPDPTTAMSLHSYLRRTFNAFQEHTPDKPMPIELGLSGMTLDDWVPVDLFEIHKDFLVIRAGSSRLDRKVSLVPFTHIVGVTLI